MEKAYRAMRWLPAEDDLRRTIALREIYRRTLEAGERLALVAERVWYAVVKEGTARPTPRRRWAGSHGYGFQVPACCPGHPAEAQPAPAGQPDQPAESLAPLALGWAATRRPAR